jgi:hypothetical protein
MNEHFNYKKTLDLHVSEWAKDGKKQPILGPGAGWFFQVTLPTLIIALVVGFGMKFIVYGLFG